MTYQLNISFDTTGLANIYAANQLVTIVKADGGSLPVAWLTFEPFERNLVSWVASYSIYASAVPLADGTTILVNAITSGAAQPGFTYTLENGFFTGASGGAPASFNAVDEQQGYSSMLLGLAQSASVNGVSVSNAPVNAMSVLFNQSASFTAIETVSIFLSSANQNGTFLSQVPSSALTVALTTQAPVANIGYNDESNMFYLQGTSTSLLSMSKLALA